MHVLGCVFIEKSKALKNWSVFFSQWGTFWRIQCFIEMNIDDNVWLKFRRSKRIWYNFSITIHSHLHAIQFTLKIDIQVNFLFSKSNKIHPYSHYRSCCFRAEKLLQCLNGWLSFVSRTVFTHIIVFSIGLFHTDCFMKENFSTLHCSSATSDNAQF